MRKKIIILILVVALLAGALIALWPTFENMAFEAKLEVIELDWNKQHNSSIFPWYHTEGFGSFYLGSDNGYDIFYCWESRNIATVPENPLSDEEIIHAFSTNIAGYTFYPATEIFTYKDGVFAPLADVFQQGLIREAAISAANTAFNKYVEEVLHSDPIAMNERELAYYSNFPGLESVVQEQYKNYNEQNMNPTISYFIDKFAQLEE